MDKTYSTSLFFSFANLGIYRTFKILKRRGKNSEGKAKGFLLLMNLNSFSICTEKEESHINGLRQPERHSPARVSKFFHEGPENKYFRFCRPGGLSDNC